MAVAVKNRPEVSSPGLMDRLGVVSLVGLVYLLGCLGIVFALVPYLWNQVWHPSFGSFAGGALLALVMIAVAVGLVIVGTRVFSGHMVPGVRAGIFVGLVWLLINLLLTRWFSMWTEHWVYESHWMSPTVGAALTGVVLFILVVFQIRMFLKRGVENFLIGFEHQGWFSATAFKPLQGLKVRRGTVFGLLMIVGAGIFTMRNHSYKNPSWTINIPFTGQYIVQTLGDAKAVDPELDEGSTLSRGQWDDLNSKMHSYVKVVLPSLSGFKADQVVPRSEFEEKVKTTVIGVPPPTSKAVAMPSAYLDYRALVLLPDLQYTLPLVLLVGALWLSWRVVNIPAFADFLIATEAELNKVSWTTRRRLVQDTIVVLVTVFLLSFYLFSMDQLWRVVLSWKPIGVLRFQEDQSEANKSIGQRSW